MTRRSSSAIVPALNGPLHRKGGAMYGVFVAVSAGFALALTLGGCGKSNDVSPDGVVGKPAPEIDGEDADGIRFKLSDYRGKVVMLDFWGHW